VLTLPNVQTCRAAEKFATNFVLDLYLDADAEEKCEWSCLLWSKDHWASDAQRAMILLEQAKQRNSLSAHSNSVAELSSRAHFLNTVAQVYTRLFDQENQTCNVKKFTNCPFINERQDFLTKGKLAGVFVTILHKATFYAMLDQHPIDSGLLSEEYTDVFGINLTDFSDLARSLTDGRFERLYGTVVKRASQLAGLRSSN
jgi:hypothetical protein